MTPDENNPTPAQAAFVNAVQLMFPNTEKPTTTILDVLITPYVPAVPPEPESIDERWLVTVRLVITGPPVQYS